MPDAQGSLTLSRPTVAGSGWPALLAPQQLILDLVGDLDPVTGDLPLLPQDGRLYQDLPVLWVRYADKALLRPRLRELYATRDACDLLLAIVAPEVTIAAAGTNVALADRIRTWQQRRTEATNEIVRIEQELASSRGPVVGTLVGQAPIPPPWPGAPDASDQRYSGSPYLRGRAR